MINILKNKDKPFEFNKLKNRKLVKSGLNYHYLVTMFDLFKCAKIKHGGICSIAVKYKYKNSRFSKINMPEAKENLFRKPNTRTFLNYKDNNKVISNVFHV